MLGLFYPFNNSHDVHYYATMAELLVDKTTHNEPTASPEQLKPYFKGCFKYLHTLFQDNKIDKHLHSLPQGNKDDNTFDWEKNAVQLDTINKLLQQYPMYLHQLPGSICAGGRWCADGSPFTTIKDFDSTVDRISPPFALDQTLSDLLAFSTPQQLVLLFGVLRIAILDHCGVLIKCDTNTQQKAINKFTTTLASMLDLDKDTVAQTLEIAQSLTLTSGDGSVRGGLLTLVSSAGMGKSHIIMLVCQILTLLGIPFCFTVQKDTFVESDIAIAYTPNASGPNKFSSSLAADHLPIYPQLFSKDKNAVFFREQKDNKQDITDLNDHTTRLTSFLTSNKFTTKVGVVMSSAHNRLSVTRNTKIPLRTSTLSANGVYPYYFSPHQQNLLLGMVQLHILKNWHKFYKLDGETFDEITNGELKQQCKQLWEDFTNNNTLQQAMAPSQPNMAAKDPQLQLLINQEVAAIINNKQHYPLYESIISHERAKEPNVDAIIEMFDALPSTNQTSDKENTTAELLPQQQNTRHEAVSVPMFNFHQKNNHYDNNLTGNIKAGNVKGGSEREDDGAIGVETATCSHERTDNTLVSGVDNSGKCQKAGNVVPFFDPLFRDLSIFGQFYQPSVRLFRTAAKYSNNQKGVLITPPDTHHDIGRWKQIDYHHNNTQRVMKVKPFIHSTQEYLKRVSKDLTAISLNKCTSHLGFEWFVVNSLSLFADNDNNEIYLPIEGFHDKPLKKITSYNHLLGLAVHPSPIYSNIRTMGQEDDAEANKSVKQPKKPQHKQPKKTQHKQPKKNPTNLHTTFTGHVKTLVTQHPCNSTTLLVPPSDYPVDLVAVTKNKIVCLELGAQQLNQSELHPFPRKGLLNLGKELSDLNISVGFGYCTNEFRPMEPTPWAIGHGKYAQLSLPEGILVTNNAVNIYKHITTYTFDELVDHEDHYQNAGIERNAAKFEELWDKVTKLTMEKQIKPPISHATTTTTTTLLAGVIQFKWSTGPTIPSVRLAKLFNVGYLLGPQSKTFTFDKPTPIPGFDSFAIDKNNTTFYYAIQESDMPAVQYEAMARDLMNVINMGIYTAYDKKLAVSQAPLLKTVKCVPKAQFDQLMDKQQK